MKLELKKEETFSFTIEGREYTGFKTVSQWECFAKLRNEELKLTVVLNTETFEVALASPELAATISSVEATAKEAKIRQQMLSVHSMLVDAMQRVLRLANFEDKTVSSVYSDRLKAIVEVAERMLAPCAEMQNKQPEFDENGLWIGKTPQRTDAGTTVFENLEELKHLSDSTRIQKYDVTLRFEKINKIADFLIKFGKGWNSQ